MIRDVHQAILFLGDAFDARDAKQLFERGIQAVVDVAANEPAAQLPREFIYCRFPLLDGGGNSPKLLKLAVSTIARLARDGVPTLIACSAGMSRSPAIAAAALSILESRPADECLARVTMVGPRDVSPLLWKQIKLACVADSL